MTRQRESGFTLPELIMSIAILGAIAASIGGVLAAAFASTAGIQERFDASRSSRQAAQYWTPDVSTAEVVNPGPECGNGEGTAPTPLVTFAWTDHPPLTDVVAPPVDPGVSQMATWWLDDTNPARIVRRVCRGDPPGAPIDTQRITARIADGDQDVAGLATDAAAASAQVAVQCSGDGVSFEPCASDDPAAVVRVSVGVLDVPDPSPAADRRFRTYQFRVAGARKVT